MWFYPFGAIQLPQPPHSLALTRAAAYALTVWMDRPGDRLGSESLPLLRAHASSGGDVSDSDEGEPDEVPAAMQERGLAGLHSHAQSMDRAAEMVNVVLAYGERVANLHKWKEPDVTSTFIGAVGLAGLVLTTVPINWIIWVLLMFRFIKKGLLHYGYIVRSPHHESNFIPATILKRVPTDVDLLRARPLPEGPQLGAAR